MIKLDVEEMCQDCPNFRPMLDRIDMTTLGGDRSFMQRVYCGEKTFCDNMREYLEKPICKE